MAIANVARLLMFFIAGCSLLATNLYAQNVERYGLVIDEIFADPTPSVGLPNAEYIEIKNTSGRSVNLLGCRLSSSTSKSGPFPSYTLPADSFLVICSTGNSGLFAPYGRVLGISSFPSLNNTGTTLSITSKENATIHAVSYSGSWFQNDVKSNGGWSLEMIDTKNPCNALNNWKASVDTKGGTPGQKNSVDGNNPDKAAPVLVRATTLDSVTIVLTFNEPLDSAKAATATNYRIGEGGSLPVKAVAIAPLFTTVKLSLSVPLKKSTIYIVTANDITDCSGNVINAMNTARVGLASDIDAFDVVINEILFNPKPNANDYVEIYNRSNKIFSLKDLYVANRSSSNNTLGGLRQLTNETMLFFPGDYIVISDRSSVVKQNYVTQYPDNFIDVTMPSFPDDQGVVVILNAQGQVIDELKYSAKWHFALIDNEEGIALERIDYNKPTQSKDNWTSAASSVGFGTPTYQNSQFRSDLSIQGEMNITPKTFSP
ncbi:MAG TPA: lamin tail domain-containing protein, partial [Segetibacter sp.]|nr:lamin tail domain-containing protein [Segetibacter sp.]